MVMGKVKERHNAAEIGQYGYSHYTGRPLDSGHDLALVPQSIAEGWEGLCSCGEWRGFASAYDYPLRDEIIDALKTAHQRHVVAP